LFLVAEKSTVSKNEEPHVTVANFSMSDIAEISRKVCKKLFVRDEIIGKTYLMKVEFGDTEN
jgi:hypothetical protein